jgi:hypothetical protein
MAVIKQLNNTPFTQIANKLIDSMDCETLGAFNKMLKCPPNWEFTRAMLMKRLGLGKRVLDRVLRQMKAHHVLTIVQTGSGWEWTVSAVPQKPTSHVSHQLDFAPVEKTHLSNIKESKENKESKKKTKIDRPRVGTRIPDDWSPSADLIDWAVSKGFEYSEIELHTEAFKLYWESASVRATKLDWGKTWKNRMLTAMDASRPPVRHRTRRISLWQS